MFWPDTQTGVDVEPARKTVQSAVRKYFTEGGVGVPPTVPGGDWFNQITNELLNVLAAAGINPSKVEDDQILHAIKRVSNSTSAREALRRSYAEAGLTLVDGSFEVGGTLTSTSDVLLYEANGQAYSWTGYYPSGEYVVFPGTNPASSPEFVIKKNVTLRDDLGKKSGAGIIGFSHDDIYAPASVGFRLKNCVYATDAPFSAQPTSSDASSEINDALVYCAANNKDLVLDHMFKIATTVTIPSNVTVICLTSKCGLDSTATGSNKAVVMSGINSRFIGGTINGINDPTSATIRQDGVSMDSFSSFCELIGVNVYGFFAKGFTGPGAGVGIADKGTRNKIINNHVVDSKFCISLGGEKGEVVGNYISNHYLTQTTEPKPWSSLSNYWDGIVSEGISDYLIAFNHVTECGQSGIYTGGNGGLSKSNRIIGNTVEKCWNRGIDQGLNLPQDDNNDVINQLISANICRNNRENNIWISGATRCNVVGNTSIYDHEYETLFPGHPGGHTGIALTNGAAGAVPHGNSITGNNCYDSDGFANISISCGLTATANTISDNTTPQGVYLVNNSLYAKNEFHFVKASDWVPVLIGGAGTVNLGVSTGRTVVRGRKANFTITINVSSVSSPSGQLTIGYVPPLSGVNLRYSDVKVTLYDGLDASIGASSLVAYITASDQVSVARCLNGSRIYDVRAFLKAGSSMTISGEVEFYG